MDANDKAAQKQAEKAKKRKKFSRTAPEGLQLIPQKEQISFYLDTGERDIAIYVRVSTDSINQVSSFEMQQSYYTEMVEHHEGWKLYKIYADEGLSGTSTKKREAFNRMIADCEAGLIDTIVTKSVSRFSRNIMDAIGTARRLSKLRPPVGVYFENEGLYTLAGDGEFRLTNSSSVAQEESRIKSVAMNSSVEMRFSHGIFLTPPLLGYDNDEDGGLVVNEDEAAIVRLIFCLYLYGYSTEKIAQTLTAQGRCTKKGNTVWNAGSVCDLLRNERYSGAVRARKTWTPDFLEHKSIKNKQDKNQYYLENHHEPIILMDDFVAVQRMLDNAKYGCQSFLPQLHAISGGALHGFVSVSPHWAAFTPEDYLAASASAGDERGFPQIVLARFGSIDLRGYTIANANLFSLFGTTRIVFAKERLRCSAACVRKLGMESAELLVHPAKKQLALRPCAKDQRNALRIKQCILQHTLHDHGLGDVTGSLVDWCGMAGRR